MPYVNFIQKNSLYRDKHRQAIFNGRLPLEASSQGTEQEQKEALQKYPEQSFAQKFSLCNRQKLSERKIKEGF